MTSPTDFTLAEARDAVRGKKISSVELTRAFLGAVEAARPLNAFVTETPERALDMAAASDARIAKGEAGALEGLPLAIKDLFCTKGVRTTAGSNILSNFVPPYESTVSQNCGTQVPSCSAKRTWTSSRWVRRTRPAILVRCSTRAFVQFEREPCAWRVVGRFGGGCRCKLLSCCDWHGHGRLDTPAGRSGGHCRAEADLRTLLALRHRCVCIVARSGRTDDEDGARRRDPDGRDGERRSERLYQRRCAGAGLRGRARVRREGVTGRHPQRISHRRHVAGDRGALVQGRGVAESPRC